MSKKIKHSKSDSQSYTELIESNPELNEVKHEIEFEYGECVLLNNPTNNSILNEWAIDRKMD